MGKIVVISTHTIGLQTQLIEKDIPQIINLFPQVNIRPVLVKGKSNYLCKQDLDVFQEDLIKSKDPQFLKIKTWAKQTDIGDKVELDFRFDNWSDIAVNPDTCRSGKCRYFDDCFYFKMRDKATSGNLLVVNHALFLSDLKAKAAEGGILPKYDYVIFDEAHTLEDVATNILGTQLNNKTILRWIDKIKNTASLAVQELTLKNVITLNNQIFDPISRMSKPEFFLKDALDSPACVLSGNMNDLVSRLSIAMDTLCLQLRDTAEQLKQGVAYDRVYGLAKMGERLKDDLIGIWFSKDYDGGAQYIRHGTLEQDRSAKTKKTVQLMKSPVEVGSILDKLLWEPIPSTVLISATLSDSGGFKYVKSRLGIKTWTQDCVVGSPFSFESKAMLYVPTNLSSPVASMDAGYGAYVDQLAFEIQKIVRLTNGGVFCLFTSWKSLNEVFEKVKPEIEDFLLLKQGDLSVGELLRQFKFDGNAVLFGTSMFWEGVDVPGDALRCVIIDRIPFAVPDSPLTQARTEILKRQKKNWFNDYSIPVAQIKLKQGFGRLIRTSNDRGVVAILDNRLMTKSYGSKFINFLPPAKRTTEFKKVREWWNGKEEEVEQLEMFGGDPFLDGGGWL